MVTTREGKATSSVNAGQGDLGGQASDSDSASSLTVSTASLDVTNPEQRTLVDQWLAAQAADPNGYVSPETFFPAGCVPGRRFPEPDVHQRHGQQRQYDNVSDKTGFAAEVKLGVAFGIDLSLETTDSRAVDATYLDVPGTNGTRLRWTSPSAIVSRPGGRMPGPNDRLAPGGRPNAVDRAARPAARQLRWRSLR